MIIGIIASLLLIFFAIGFYNASKLKVIEIEKTVNINAPQQRVYEMISQLNNYPAWSPFLVQDPSQKYNVTGTDGAVGSQFHWEGNKGKDVGYQEIVKLNPGTFVWIVCNIQKPFKASPTFNYTITSHENIVTVTQNFTLKSQLTDAFFMWLFGVKKEMKATNEMGLKLLKTACEK